MSTQTILTLRAIKGSPLTNDEMDENFSRLRITADTALDEVRAIVAPPLATTDVPGLIKVGDGLVVAPDGTISASVSSQYALPTATTLTLGGIKVGNGLSVTVEGVVSLQRATDTVLGGVKAGPGLTASPDGTLSVTSQYTLVAADAATLGGVKVGSGLNITGDGTLSALIPAPYVLPAATVSTIGGVRPGTGLTVDGSGVLTSNILPFFTGAGTANLSQNGFQKLPSGLIIQWGVENSMGDDAVRTVNFPTAFATACFSVTTSSTLSNAGGSRSSSGNPRNVTKTSFILEHVTDAGYAASIFWMAFGV